MWYTTFVVRTRARPTALPATSHSPASARKSRKSNHCQTSAISARNSFACHTYKSKVLCLPHIFQINRETPAMVNLVAA
jgi:hypothetical protein